MARLDYAPKLLQRAVAEHERGNLAEAGRICEPILKQERRNFWALEDFLEHVARARP